MSTWFFSSRSVVGPLPGKSAAALTMNNRVHVMWSSQSLRMASWKPASLDDIDTGEVNRIVLACDTGLWWSQIPPAPSVHGVYNWLQAQPSAIG
jgi:hypothetical protein